MAERPGIAERLATLRRAWTAALPDRVDAIAARVAPMLSGERAWDAAEAHELRREVHSLAGAGATFGLADVSARARELELLLQAIEESGSAPEVDARGAALDALEALEALRDS